MTNKSDNPSMSAVTDSERKPTATPRTKQELSSALAELITAAHENGVTVEGGWEVRNDSSTPDWEVHVTEVAKTD